MSRKVSIIAVIVVVLAGVLPLLSGCGAAKAKPDDFVGNWKEPGLKPPYVMNITAAGDDVYAVTYRRFYRTEARFRFADGELSFSSASSNFTDVITYDADAHTITITNANGRSYTLSPARP